MKSPSKYDIIDYIALLSCFTYYSVSGISKLLHPYETYIGLMRYQILGPEGTLFFAISSSILCVTVAILLLPSSMRSIAVKLGVIIVIIGLSFQVSAMIKGLDIDCGCFPGILDRRIGWQSIGTDVLLGFLILYVGWRSKPQYLSTRYRC